VRVVKFGGTSVGDPTRIVAACDIVAGKRAKGPVVVVVSAASKVTDMLLKAANAAAAGVVDAEPVVGRVRSLLDAFSLPHSLIEREVLALREALATVAKTGSLSLEHADLVASFGERFSVRTFAAVLSARGVTATAFDAFDVGMITDAQFGAAEPLSDSAARVRDALGVDGVAHAKDSVAVVTGFIGKTEDGRVTTLGRGGSDYSAALFGAAMRADEIEIWTDVDGVMTADPRVVRAARTIPVLSFTEAAELAYFGAKVLHPKTIHPAVRENIPVRVLNTFNPEGEGTVILEAGAPPDLEHPARAIAAKKSITMVQVVSSRMLLAHGFLAKLFEVFARHRIAVDMVATSEVSVTLTVDRDDLLTPALNELRRIGDVQVVAGRSLVAIVGLGIGDALGIAGRVFSALARARVNIELISAGSGRANMSLVVADADADAAVRALHHAIFDERA
jgi:aspartate kinase